MSNIQRMVQKVKTRLLPESGLTMDPPVVDDLEVDNVLSRVLGYLLAYNGSKMQLLKASTAGALHTVNLGSGLSLVDVESGTGADAYSGGNTFNKTTAQSKAWVIVETNPATVAFFDSSALAMDEMNLPVGVWEFDLVNYGAKIKNRTGGSNTAYQFWFLS
jgi:hypothetical protein